MREDSRAIYRRNYQSPPLPRVLTRFSIQVAGASVVVTDADGSVYSGQLAAGEAGAAGMSPGGDGVRFRAAGKNRALNQTVTIDGRLGGATRLADAPVGGLGKAVLATGGRAAFAGDLPAATVVEGRVTVGGTQFPIRASRAPVAP